MMEGSIDGDSGRMSGKARTRDANAYEAKLLDAVNLRLLKELEADGRLGIAELGRRVGMSAPAVAERVQRLERAGVIAGLPGGDRSPRARIPDLGDRADPALAGPAPADPRVARETPEVAECYRITGEDCYLLRLHLRAIDDLEDVLDRFTPYGLTTTSIIHSAPVPRRGPPLQG